MADRTDGQEFAESGAGAVEGRPGKVRVADEVDAIEEEGEDGGFVVQLGVFFFERSGR